MADKSLKIVNPRERITVYGTGKSRFIKAGEAAKVSSLLAEKLINMGQVTLDKPTTKETTSK